MESRTGTGVSGKAVQRTRKQPANMFVVIIYGRRRVGETTTIAHFSKGKPNIIFLADRSMETTLMQRLLGGVARFLHDDLLAQATPPNWDWVFGQLVNRADFSQKIVLVLDEFQSLAQVNSAFPSILQRLWDEQLKSRNLMLILCGSLVGMMYQTTLAYESPLYGRRTGQIRMRPLTFAAIREAFPEMSFNETVELYAVSGGVPVYVEALTQASRKGADKVRPIAMPASVSADKVRPGAADKVRPGARSLMEQIEECVLDPTGRLYDEPRFVLGGEVSDTTVRAQ